MSKFKEAIENSAQKPLTVLLEEKLDKESLQDFYSALEDTSIAIPVLVSVLSNFGVETSTSVLQRWRKNGIVPSTMRRKKNHE